MLNSVIVIGLPIALPKNDEVLSTIIGNLINSLQLNLRFDVEDAVVTTYDADSINNAILSDFVNSNNRGKSRKKVREVTVDPILQAITFIGGLFENQLKNKQNITIALKIPRILSVGDEISVALKNAIKVISENRNALLPNYVGALKDYHITTDVINILSEVNSMM